MAVLVDDDAASTNNVSGLFGLQIEGTPCKVSFRNPGTGVPPFAPERFSCNPPQFFIYFRN
jgi:hypothetical protein